VDAPRRARPGKPDEIFEDGEEEFGELRWREVDDNGVGFALAKKADLGVVEDDFVDALSGEGGDGGEEQGREG
jgi:hypothetical protein